MWEQTTYCHRILTSLNNGSFRRTVLNFPLGLEFKIFLNTWQTLRNNFSKKAEEKASACKEWKPKVKSALS